MSDLDNKDLRRIEAYRKELEADPRSLVFVALAEALNRVGAYDEAASVAARGLEHHEDSVAARLALAVAEAGRRNVREALEQIKAALILDQENPRALALMGQLLLEKGLARRAVQFLGQAVKLAPGSREYGELLRRARRLASEEGQVPLPVVRGDDVVESDSPWTDDGALPVGDSRLAASESEHTVFDPDAVSGGPRRPPASGAAERAVAPVSDTEHTHFAAGLPDLERGARPSTGPREEPRRSKPKVGGSAADWSRVIRRGADPDGVAAEYTVAAPKDAFLEPATVDGVDRDALESVPIEARTTRLGGEAIAQLQRTRPPVQAPSVVAAAARGPSRSEPPTPVPKAPSVVAAEARREEAPEPVVLAEASSPTDRPGPAPDEDRAPSRPPAPPKPPTGSAEPARGDRAAAEPRPDPKSESRPEPKADPPSPPAEAAAPADEKSESKSAAEAGPRSEPPARPPKPAKPPKAAKSEPAPAEAAPPELLDLGSSGRPATMFVDDAVWAIYGGERPAAAAPPPEGEAAKPAPKVAKAEPAAAPAPRRRSVLVVRTSERFGQITRWVSVGVAATLIAWASYSIAVSSGGAAPVEATEEMRGVAADMERGGLASLFAAEEAIQSLLPQAPNARPVLLGALAEVRAKRWADFGEVPEARSGALQALADRAGAEPTVEALSARVALSTSAADRAAVAAQLDRLLQRFPSSPKAWSVRARIAELDGRPDEALTALFTAHALHPARRDTLLALARWHAAAGAHGAAFGFFDELLSQDAHRDDVEALLDRYVLGAVTGADPAKNDAESRLAGLVREELPHVAKDEVGRVALVFAATLFAREDVPGGLEQLAEAEAAYERSAPFKRALGDVLLAAGEWSRAREQYERALELAPDDGLRVARARADYGAKAEPPREPRPRSGERSRGQARLPFGVVRLGLEGFARLLVEPDVSVFPEAAYRAARAEARGPELERRLEAENLAAIAARRLSEGKAKSAVKLLESARELASTAAIESRLGWAHVARKSWRNAQAAFERAMERDPSDLGARFGLGRVLAERGDALEAIDTLEPFAADDVMAPEALRLLAGLKAQRGDDAGALELLGRVALVAPRDAGLQLEVGRRNHQLRRPNEALAAYRRAVEADAELGELPRRRGPRSRDSRNAIDLYYLGRVVLERSESRAVGLLTASARQDDAPDEVHFYLGRALLGSRKTRKAGRRALETYLKAAPGGELAAQAERLLRGR